MSVCTHTHIMSLLRAVKQKGYFSLCKFREMYSTGDEGAGVIIMSQSWNKIKLFSGSTKSILITAFE